MRVKGIGKPINVYEVTGLGALRTRLQRAADRGLTKFVGREHELDALKKTLELANAGHGRIVATVGEPGVGKSRLFYESRQFHSQHVWSWRLFPFPTVRPQPICRLSTCCATILMFPLRRRTQAARKGNRTSCRAGSNSGRYLAIPVQSAGDGRGARSDCTDGCAAQETAHSRDRW
jgi:AAA ATPase domain